MIGVSVVVGQDEETQACIPIAQEIAAIDRWPYAKSRWREVLISNINGV